MFNFVKAKDPSLEVIPTTFPPPKGQLLLSQIVIAAQCVLIALIVVGERAFQFLSMPTPAWWVACAAVQHAHH